MFGGRLNRLTASLIRRIRAKFLAQIIGRNDMARYWQHKETGNCCAVVEDSVDLSYRYTEITKEQYSLHEGAKNTEQANQPDSGE